MDELRRFIFGRLGRSVDHLLARRQTATSSCVHRSSASTHRCRPSGVQSPTLPRSPSRRSGYDTAATRRRQLPRRSLAAKAAGLRQTTMIDKPVTQLTSSLYTVSILAASAITDIRYIEQQNIYMQLGYILLTPSRVRITETDKCTIKCQYFIESGSVVNPCHVTLCEHGIW